jgi:tetratricopeptide (TPR) repeat protein
MKYLKVLICLLFFQFLFVISPLTLMAENPVSQKPETENQEKNSKIVLSEIYNLTGNAFYKKKEYTAAIECYQKALKMDPTNVIYIINLARSYREDGRFEEAHQFLSRALDKFPQKENQKQLQIALADVHFWWAYNLSKKFDHANAIEHFEVAYDIDKVYRPRNTAVYLINFGFLYNARVLSASVRRALRNFFFGNWLPFT